MSIMDMFSLKGKNALVIGGSKGLGEGIARGLVEAGAVIRLTATRRRQELRK